MPLEVEQSNGSSSASEEIQENMGTIGRGLTTNATKRCSLFLIL